MNNYIDGKMIKELREKKHLSQKELADKLLISDKTISKWETNHGLPDISMLESLSKALSISLIELFNSSYIVNENKASNMLKMKYYVCPICHNIIRANGESVISCCGVTLPPLVATDKIIDGSVSIETIEGDLFVEIKHEMSKNNYLLFISYVTTETEQFIKWYPEQSANARFMKKGHGFIYYYDLKEGLFKIKF